jgi:hypothetical protein
MRGIIRWRCSIAFAAAGYATPRACRSLPIINPAVVGAGPHRLVRRVVRAARGALAAIPGRRRRPQPADARRRLVRFEHWCRTARAGRSTCRPRRDEDLLPRGARPRARQAVARSRTTAALCIPIGWRWRTKTCTARRCCTPCRRWACRCAGWRAGRCTRRRRAGRSACPGGTLQLGGDAVAAASCSTTKGPPRSCRVAPFAIDAALVSNAQYLPISSRMAATRTAHWSEAGRPG